MIDEHRQDLAAEYALDALDPESTRAFEAMLAGDPELKALADDLRETAAALAHACARTTAPAGTARARSCQHSRRGPGGHTSPTRRPSTPAPSIAPAPALSAGAGVQRLPSLPQHSAHGRSPRASRITTLPRSGWNGTSCGRTETL